MIFKIITVGLLANIFVSAAFAQQVGTGSPTTDLVKSGQSTPPHANVDSVEIAKKLANPIANMISLPLQYEYSRGMGVGQGGSEQTVLFQPVMPFDLGGGDVFIVRPIIPGVRETSIKGVNGQSYSGYGVGNVTVESFYAPNTNSSWIYGIGPYVSSPAGSGGKFGSQQTAAGITAVVLNRDGPWTYGILGYQSWNVGGSSVYGTQNNAYGQPFLSYTTKEAFTITANMEASYNYDTHRTSNPLYVGVSKVKVVDGVPLSFGAGPMYYVSNIPGGPSGWGARATFTVVMLK
jgi:hypothetical protein